MSGGRRSVALADLQRVADDGFQTSVARMLLGADQPMGDFRVVPVVRNVTTEALETADDGLSRPADWQFRTTAADIDRMVAERASRSLPASLAALIDLLVFGTAIPADMEFSLRENQTVRAVVAESRREVLRDLPRTYEHVPRAKKEKHRVRWDGPCSAVVTTKRNGKTYVDGKRVKPKKAAKALRRLVDED